MMVDVEIGAMLDFALDESKKSVYLVHKETSIATLSANDTLPIVTALKLGRTMYAIVTDIKENEMEVEGWTKIN